MWRSRSLLLLVSALIMLQTSCRPVRESTPVAPAAPAARPELPVGYSRYAVIAGESEVRALVFRDGPMARLGHNHVVSSHGLQGSIDLGGKRQEPRFSIVLPVESFTVDDAAARAEEGDEFQGVVADDAIAGTRRNLLGEALLDAVHFPDIRLTSRRVAGTAPDVPVTLVLQVKGTTRELHVPVHVEQLPGEVRATGQLTVTHAELGLTPFSVMGGLLSVKDDIRLRFRIVARQGPTRPD